MKPKRRASARPPLDIDARTAIVKSLIPPLSLLCLLLTGCHNYESRTYDVTVHNRTAEPITIWLTKDGPPYEAGWLSPEDLAIESPRQNENREIGGVIVAAGKSASAMRA